MIGMIKILAVVCLCLFFASCRSQSDRANSNEAPENNNTSSNNDVTHVEDAFRVECGCRDLYLKIRNTGDQNTEAIIENFRAASSPIARALIMKNPKALYGQPIIFTGRAVQIREYPTEDGSITRALIQVGRGGDDLITAMIPTSSPFVDGDRVVIVGYLAGHTDDYKSVSQWDMSVPIVVTRAILTPKEATRYRLAAKK